MTKKQRYINPDFVFSRLEEQCENGGLSASVTKSSVKYQSSKNHPSYLEQINEDGSSDIGTFKGEFHPSKERLEKITPKGKELNILPYSLVEISPYQNTKQTFENKCSTSENATSRH